MRKDAGSIMKQHCVVLADNHQNMLEGIRGLLESVFETVVMVADKISLFEALDKIKPELAVVDLSLPVSGEVHITRQLSGRYPDLKLIMLSIHDEPAAAKRVMSAGALGFVLKRCAGTDLLAAVQSVNKGGTFVSPAVEKNRKGVALRKFFNEKIFLNFAFAVIILNITGCALTRNPVPTDKMSDAVIAEMPNIRYWEINYKPDLDLNSPGSLGCDILALSGGGANGAFGAGFLCGWTASGARPNFRIVTGISTGSLIAPIAFAGSDYDDRLQKYTTVKTKDILEVRWVFGIMPMLIGESFADTEPLKKLIRQTVDDEVFKAVAREHARGRRLYVGTTNMDAQRFMIWDMGAIASSGHPDSKALFYKVMLASASIPGAFPPQYFDVEVNGKKYDEMHSDGGVITEVFGYGSLFTQTPASGQLPNGICHFYVIRNGKLATESQQVPRKTLKIVTRSLDTLMKAHSWGDIFRLYFVAARDKIEFGYVSIPDDYVASGKEPFDPVEMKRLFDLGYDMAKTGYKWNKVPPLIGDTSEHEWTWTPKN